MRTTGARPPATAAGPAPGPRFAVLTAELPSADGYLETMRSCFAHTYAGGSDVWTDEPAMAHAAKALADLLPPAAHVLDIGAGRGRDSRFLAQLGHHVTAVDIVDTFAVDASDLDGSVRFIPGTPADLAPRARFDGVLDNGCLHHQHPDHLPDYLAAVARRLTPDGRYVVSVFSRTDGDRVDRITDRGRLNLELAPAALEGALAAAGLRVIGRQEVHRSDPGRSYSILTAAGTDDAASYSIAVGSGSGTGPR